MTPIGLTIAVELLEQVREQLDARVVSAGWETTHGDVMLACDGDGVAMTVNGEQVPIAEME